MKAKKSNDYFVFFPEFFEGKEDDIGILVYLGINSKYQNIPNSVNIIFTRSNRLEEIKNKMREDWEFAQNMHLEHREDERIKFVIQKFNKKLQNMLPQKPIFELKFKKGHRGFFFSKEENMLMVFYSKKKLPSTENVFFYPE